MTVSTDSALSPAPVARGFGMTVVDRQLLMTRLPAGDEKRTARAARTQIGGPVPTALAAFVKLGGRAELLSAWADDVDGRLIEEDLRRCGVGFDPTGCRCAAVTGVAHVWTEDGTGRRCVAALPPDPPPSAEAATAFGSPATLLHLDGWGGAAAVAAARAAVDHGGTVVLDAGSPKPATAEVLGLAAVVNVPRHFLGQFFGDEDVERGVTRLLALGPRRVFVTDGGRGVTVAADGLREQIPAFPVEARDTCGAGDAFCGGLLWAEAAGCGPLETARFAAAVAALKVSRVGNRAALPSLGEVEELLGCSCG